MLTVVNGVGFLRGVIVKALLYVPLTIRVRWIILGAAEGARSEPPFARKGESHTFPAIGGMNTSGAGQRPVVAVDRGRGDV